MGGMFGESKYDVLKKIPRQYIPKTILINLPTTKEEVLEKLKHENFQFPIIFKPDLGERGFMVKRIYSEHDIDNYLTKVKIDFLAQELVDHPLELGIFYKRLPSQQRGEVTSIVIKEMLSVTGDGKSSLRELILKKDRAKLQWRRLKEMYHNRLNDVLSAAERLELVSIGNHALGTKFINGNHLINEKLSLVFDEISKQIEGFYFGRFDLRCANMDDLYQSKISIVELNGCGAEPAHIYDPNFRLLHAIKALLVHWRNIFEVARENRKQGVAFITFKEALQHYKRFKAATAP